MTICCESCTSPVSAQCGSPASSHPRAMETRQTSCKRFRSTKGASKARRDQINVEIRSMRALLPLPQEEVDRLSYLHSMSLICAYLRKALLLQGLSAGQGYQSGLPCEAFLNALPGFILVLSADGRLLYVSENVSDYLGHSMVDVLQGDSFYDMVEHHDLEAVKSHLETDPTSSTERSFMCRMHTSKSFRLQHGSCSLLVKGRFHPLPPSSQRVFMALCTPTADRQGTSAASRSQNCFTSSHRPDMTFTQLSDSVLFHLGCSAEELIGRSWYSLLHPDDLSLGASSHKNLMQADEGSQVELVVRLQSRELSWTWLYICATRDTGGQGMSCTNYTVSETEAAYLRQKIHSDTYCPSPTPQLPLGQGNCPGRGSKRQRSHSCEDLQPRAKAARAWDPDVYYLTCSSSDIVSPTSTSDTHALFCTPPYSPTSSHSPPQQEDTSSDFLLDVYDYTEQLLPSPDSSPPYYPHPDPHPDPHPAHLPLPLGPEQAYEQGVYSLAGPLSPESCLSPSYDYPDCTADVHLVPDCLPVSDSENCADCALHPEDQCLPVDPPGGASSFPAQHVPQAVTPDLSPTSTSSCQYSEREQEEISILAQQISSLARSFDRYHTLSPVGPPSQPPSAPTLPSACDWIQHPPPVLPPLKAQLVLDEGVFDSILKDLEMVPEKEVMPPCFSHQAGPHCGLEVSQNRPLDVGSLQQTPGLSLSSLVEGLDQFSPASSPLDTLPLPAPCHHQHSELHQLNHYLHTSLQQGNQDGLVEESMY
ncbi:neuronal PAS domain-containing protein 4-like [Osmerus mordax]|uniref:neuronal PAS domain-containing protein 4-like n=1 Tax=Osmerus mordax TaxID=8014 RepID=UPI00350F205B